MELIAAQFVPLMFAGLLIFLLSGFPVAFGLAATGLSFGLLGMLLGLFPLVLFQALPLRVFGVGRGVAGVRIHARATGRDERTSSGFAGL